MSPEHTLSKITKQTQKQNPVGTDKPIPVTYQNQNQEYEMGLAGTHLIEKWFPTLQGKPYEHSIGNGSVAD